MKQWTSKQIRDFRKSCNLYQREFAERLGVTREYVIYLEKGLKSPSKTLKLLMDRLEKDLKRKVKKGAVK